jgi:hypothetical protein
MTFEEATERAIAYKLGMSDLIDYIKKEGMGAAKGFKAGDLISQEKMGAGLFQKVAGDSSFTPAYHMDTSKRRLQDLVHGHTLGDNPWASVIKNPTTEFGTTMQKAFDYFGALQGMNLSAMGGSDSLFQAFNYRMSMRGQSYRLARAEGKSGQELIDHMAFLMDTPTKEMQEQAMKDALDGSFQRKLDPSTGAYLDRMGHGINYLRHQNNALSILVPFVTTPTNIMRDVLDRVPFLNATNILSGMASENQRIIKEGGAAADELLAKWAMGGVLLTMGAGLASSGILVGGLEFDKDGVKRLSNIQQYSLKIGDKSYSINGLDPLGMFLGLAADVTDAFKHRGEESALSLMGAGFTAMGKNLMSKSYMTGLFDFFAMANDVSRKSPEQGQKAVENWAAKNATSFTPFGGLVKNIKQQYDPITRDYQNWRERFMAMAPVSSEHLYPRRNVLTGEPIKSEGGWGIDAISPFYSKTVDNSPIVKELVRMNMSVDPVSKTFATKKGMTPEQYDRMQVIATQEVLIGGKTLKESLKALVTSPRWDKMREATDAMDTSSGSKQSAIRSTITHYRQLAERRMMREDAGYREAQQTLLTNKVRAKQGKELLPTN